MQQHPPYMDRRQARLINITNKSKCDDFYTKLERIRLSAAASSSSKYLNKELAHRKCHYLYSL